MAVIRRTLSKSVDIIDIDDISENGNLLEDGGDTRNRGEI